MKKSLLATLLSLALLFSLFASCSEKPEVIPDPTPAPAETDPGTLSEEGASEESVPSNALRFIEDDMVSLGIAREIDLEDRLAAIELLPLDDGYLLYAQSTEENPNGDPSGRKLTLDADFQILSEKALGKEEYIPVQTYPSAEGEGYRLIYLSGPDEDATSEESSGNALAAATLYKGDEELFSIPYPEGGFDEVYLLEAPEGVYIINSGYLLLNGEPITLPMTEAGSKIHGHYFLTLDGSNFAVFTEMRAGLPGDAYITPISDGKFGQVVRFDSAADVTFLAADEEYVYYDAGNRLYRTDGETVSECNILPSFGISEKDVRSFFIKEGRLVILTENKILILEEKTA